MIEFFLRKHTFQNQVESFNKLYKRVGGVIDLIQVIKAFPDFNFFDYMSPPHFKSLDAETFGLKIFYVQRNNFFYCVLIEVIKLGKSLDIMNKHIDTFVKLNNENKVIIDVETDYFFLLLLGLKDKAKILLVKFNNYLKQIFKANREIDPFFFFGKMNVETPFYELSYDQIWIMRKILKSIIERQFYEGLEFVIKVKEDLFLYMMEGDIWKKIVLNFDEIDTHSLWELFLEQLKESKDARYVSTIELSHDPQFAPGLKSQKDEFNKLKSLGKQLPDEELRRFEEIASELGLPEVRKFTDLLNICFRFSKTHHAYFLITKAYNTPGIINQEVFEVCMQNNEDISM